MQMHAALLGTIFSLTIANALLSPQHSSDLTRGQLVLGKGNINDEQDLSKVIEASPFLSFHRDLVELPSVSSEELDLGLWLEKYLISVNFTVQRQHVDQSPGSSNKKPRYNLIARPDQSQSRDTNYHRAGPKVILTSHIDTVPPFLPYKLSSKPSASSSSFDPKDIIVAGRGTVDDKACVAAQTHALISLLSTNAVSQSDVALVFVVDEERYGTGMRAYASSPINKHLAESYHTVIFGEPTEGKLAAGHKGVLGVSVSARGKAAHSGYPWLGRSANSMLLPVLTKLDMLGNIPESEGGLPASSKYGNTTVNIGRFEGGVAANVVAESASAIAAIRLAGGDAETAKKTIMRAVKDSAIESEGLEVSFSGGYGPIDIDTDVEGFDTITVNYGTDIPNLELKEGVKKYLYGPGSILVAHGANESLTVGDLEESVEGYKKLVLAALKREV